MIYFGEHTPKLGFGMMRLPRTHGQIDIEETKKMVDAFMDAGLNYFDTAYVYEGSEEATRKALVERYKFVAKKPRACVWDKSHISLDIYLEK